MNQWNGCSFVQILHALSDLRCPINEQLGRKTGVQIGKNFVKRAAVGVFHDENEVWWGEAHAFQENDVGMMKKPEELGFLANVFDY